MSGAKRRTKYRKHVEADILEGLPEPQEGECIVQVTGLRGGNMLEVKSASGEEALCLLPSKFRKLVWVKRGNFVIASFSDEDYATASGSKGKVKYTVTHILFKDQVKHLQKQNLWPKEFLVDSLDLSRASVSSQENHSSTCEDTSESQEEFVKAQQGENEKESPSLEQLENKRQENIEEQFEEGVDEDEGDVEEVEEDIFVNRNRLNAATFIESSSEEESSDEEEESC